MNWSRITTLAFESYSCRIDGILFAILHQPTANHWKLVIVGAPGDPLLNHAIFLTRHAAELSAEATRREFLAARKIKEWTDELKNAS